MALPPREPLRAVNERLEDFCCAFVIGDLDEQDHDRFLISPPL